MSTVTCTFAQTGASWLQEIICDCCGLKLVAEGAQPQSQRDPLPAISEAQLAGWASYRRDHLGHHSVQLRRDWCPSCASVQEDMFIMRDAAATGTEATRVLGRGGELIGRVMQGEMFGQLRCRRVPGCARVQHHDGECSAAPEPGYVVCPACPDGSRVYTHDELGRHAVGSHEVRRGPSGWCTLLEARSVFYGDAFTALIGEARLMESRAREAESQISNYEQDIIEAGQNLVSRLRADDGRPPHQLSEHELAQLIEDEIAEVRQARRRRQRGW